jgi:hypothetical protein
VHILGLLLLSGGQLLLFIFPVLHSISKFRKGSVQVLDVAERLSQSGQLLGGTWFAGAI